MSKEDIEIYEILSTDEVCELVKLKCKELDRPLNPDELNDYIKTQAFNKVMSGAVNQGIVKLSIDKEGKFVYYLSKEGKRIAKKKIQEASKRSENKWL